MFQEDKSNNTNLNNIELNENTYFENRQDLEDKKANNLSYISIALLFIPKLLVFLTSFIFEKLIYINNNFISSIINNISSGIYTIIPLTYIIGLILMINVRVKYPKNKTGKIAMWLYIIITSIEILLLILVLMFLTLTLISCVSCIGEMKGCD